MFYMLDFNKWYANKWKYPKMFLAILIVFFFMLPIVFFLKNMTKNGYFLFIEFNDAYGLKEGTCVNYKGVKVGEIHRINLHMNKVVILLKINSSKILIPRDVIFEANQIGLFNDIVISINKSNDSIYAHYKGCFQISNFITPNSYIKGYKGISYDDLIRSTTRISQRFDDPRFFSLFYLLLKNGIYISDEILLLIYNSSTLCNLLIESITLIFARYLF
uniref:Mce/MlaD domain-containing protein n=1 Tax=Vertebrata lanosa TaxID=1261582 RepID=A0A0B5W5W5_9FLOR|nr:hypothetical protein [Vertebrata lanosa]AJH66006.1 hypothetical protein [Vertebrata lanosa]